MSDTTVQELQAELTSWKRTAQEAQARVIELEAKLLVTIEKHTKAQQEVRHLKEIVQADKTTEAKTIRVSFSPAKAGWTLLVTDPIGDEQKLADTIAGLMATLLSVYEEKVFQRLTAELNESRKICKDYKRYWDLAEDGLEKASRWRNAWEHFATLGKTESEMFELEQLVQERVREATDNASRE